MKQLNQELNKMFRKLQVKITIFFAVLLTISLASVFFVSSYIIQESIMEETQELGNSIVEQMNQNVAMQLNHYEKSMKLFSQDDDLLSFLNEPSEEKLNNVLHSYQSFLQMNPLVKAILIGTEKKEIYTEPLLDLPDDFDPTSRPWYQEALENRDKVVWTEPYEDGSTGELLITGAKVIEQNGKILGVIGYDVSLEAVDAIVNNIDLVHHGYAYLMTENGIAVSHPTLKGKNLYELNYMNRVKELESGVIRYEDEKEEKMMIFDTIPGLGWKLGVVYPYSDLLKTAENVKTTHLLITIGAVILTIISSFFVTRTITKPILSLTEEASKVAQGDLTVTVQINSKDEIGSLAESFNQMVANMRNIVESMKKSVNRMNDSSEHLSAVSVQTMAASEQISAAIDYIAKGSNEQAKNVDSMNEQMKSLSNSIECVNKSIQNVEQLSKESEDASYNGLETLNQLQLKSKEANQEIQTVEHVLNGLADKINHITDVITTISNISDQTNLLALNASIEAARVGESGKGFAVVAQEVRKLAEQSAEATEKISKTIQGIQAEAENAVQAMKRSKEMNDKQQHAVHLTGDAFQKIATKMNELIYSIRTVTENMNEINNKKIQVIESLQNISAISEQSTASIEEVSASTNEQLNVFETVSQSAEELHEFSKKLQKIVKYFSV